MDAYCKKIQKLEAKFHGLKFHHVLKDYNIATNVLSKLRSKRALVPVGVFVQALNSPTVKFEEDPPTKRDLVPAKSQEVLVIESNWRAPIIDFVIHNKSYPEKKEYEKLSGRAASYVIMGNDLFKHIVSLGTLSKCISQRDEVALLSKIHLGIHAGASTPKGKTFRFGFYWPTMLADAHDSIKKCMGC
ncbi:uncharacterized protein LOC112878627 [Panicum hallii]|uniref:uncharacterized protein LOC112878627 n=1 Tax=Panicum hallii TaxID=206008 RepID=UPI000DF4E8F9|nr:uncharacterized protein LOC112878627 [Panicum hallii]